MPGKIDVSVTPQSLTARAGDTIEAAVTLQNLGATIDQLTVRVEGLEDGWYSLPVSSVALFPNDKDNLKIIFSPPRNTEVAGSVPFRILVDSQASPGEKASVDMSINIQALPEVEISLSPESARGRRGNFKVMVGNPGSSAVRLQLQARDSHGSLRYRLQPEDLTVPAGGQAQASLEADLGWLSLFGGGKDFAFQVLATAPDAEEGKAADGKLTRVAWYRMLPQIRLPRVLVAPFQRPPEIVAFKAQTDDHIEFKLDWAVKRSKDVKLNEEAVANQGEKMLSPSANASLVLTASNKYGTATRTIEIEPRLVPAARTSERIRVTLSSSDLSCQAGGIPETISVGLQNLGDTVDKFVVAVEGLDESWYSRSASSVALMPQATEQIQVSFHPPKKKGTKARAYPFAVTVRSQNSPDDVAIVTGQVKVTSLIEYKMKVAPYRVTTHGKGTYRVSLASTGTSDARIMLSATDLEEGLRFKFSREEPVLAAWDAMEIPVVVKSKRGGTVGERKRYDITITSATEDGNSQTANCELDHRPLIASWRTVFRTVRIILFVGIIAALIGFLIHWGGGLGLLRASPQTWWNHLMGQVVTTFGGLFTK